MRINSSSLPPQAGAVASAYLAVLMALLMLPTAIIM